MCGGRGVGRGGEGGQGRDEQRCTRGTQVQQPAMQPAALPLVPASRGAASPQLGRDAVGVQAGDGGAVDVQQLVPRLDARLLRGRAADGRQHHRAAATMPGGEQQGGALSTRQARGAGGSCWPSGQQSTRRRSLLCAAQLTARSPGLPRSSCPPRSSRRRCRCGSPGTACGECGRECGRESVLRAVSDDRDTEGAAAAVASVLRALCPALHAQPAARPQPQQPQQQQPRLEGIQRVNGSPSLASRLGSRVRASSALGAPATAVSDCTSSSSHRVPLNVSSTYASGEGG